uniref:TNFR-Cys domain-containing protein n=1 Tax=Scleropages formosus TaxID=113540 RepID=A0A8C9TIA6_SCLFO
MNIFVILLIVKYNLCSACDETEYEIDGKCCPMCPPGTKVSRHCTMYTSTLCVPCTGSTFTDKPNRHRICNTCTTCNQAFGLKTVKECTASSDAVCGALEGNYCIDPYEGGCRAAQKHTTCKPGHFIKHPGQNGLFHVFNTYIMYFKNDPEQCGLCPGDLFNTSCNIWFFLLQEQTLLTQCVRTALKTLSQMDLLLPVHHTQSKIVTVALD